MEKRAENSIGHPQKHVEWKKSVKNSIGHIKKHIEWKNTLKNDNNHHSLIPLYLHTLPESC